METDNKEKLTLRELAGYLPYGLELICYEKDRLVDSSKIKMVAIDTEEHFCYYDNEPTAYISGLCKEHDNARGNYGLLEIKPI